MECTYCSDYCVCSGVPCPEHPLKIGMVKDMCDALDGGNWWGDMVVSDETARIAAETPSERFARMMKVAAEDAKRMSTLM